MSSSTQPIQLVRILGITEGISYILLLFVAMPLKYLADMPLAVRVTGSAHGALFVLFAAALVWAVARRGWSIERAMVVFLASLIPFGAFFVEMRDEPRGAQASS